MKINSAHLVLIIFSLLPVLEGLILHSDNLSSKFIPIIIFAIIGLGATVITGFLGQLHLGLNGCIALGAFTYSILTCDIYPFQLGFFYGLGFAAISGVIAGLCIGIPTVRLSGDYLAIVTLGFGEIVQVLIRNLDNITKGTQGINPLPAPFILGSSFTSSTSKFYLFLALFIVLLFFLKKIEHAAIGRRWIAIKCDELASSCMGIDIIKLKLIGVCLGSAIASIGGALYAIFLGSSGEPSTYDFQLSVMALSAIIVGGLGNLDGVLLGTIFIFGFNSIFLSWISGYLTSSGLLTSSSVFLLPSNYKFMIFGLVLILMMKKTSTNNSQTV